MSIILFTAIKGFHLIVKRSYRFWKVFSNLISILHNLYMADPILYLSMFLGLGGVYVLISSFNDDDDDSNDDGERYIYNLEYTKLVK